MIGGGSLQPPPNTTLVGDDTTEHTGRNQPADVDALDDSLSQCSSSSSSLRSHTAALPRRRVAGGRFSLARATLLQKLLSRHKRLRPPPPSSSAATQPEHSLRQSSQNATITTIPKKRSRRRRALLQTRRGRTKLEPTKHDQTMTKTNTKPHSSERTFKSQPLETLTIVTSNSLDSSSAATTPATISPLSISHSTSDDFWESSAVESSKSQQENAEEKDPGTLENTSKAASEDSARGTKHRGGSNMFSLLGVISMSVALVGILAYCTAWSLWCLSSLSSLALVLWVILQEFKIRSEQNAQLELQTSLTWQHSMCTASMLHLKRRHTMLSLQAEQLRGHEQALLSKYIPRDKHSQRSLSYVHRLVQQRQANLAQIQARLEQQVLWHIVTTVLLTSHHQRHAIATTTSNNANSQYYFLNRLGLELLMVRLSCIPGVTVDAAALRALVKRQGGDLLALLRQVPGHASPVFRYDPWQAAGTTTSFKQERNRSLRSK